MNYCFSSGLSCVDEILRNTFLVILQEAVILCGDTVLEGPHVKCKVWKFAMKATPMFSHATEINESAKKINLVRQNKKSCLGIHWLAWYL